MINMEEQVTISLKEYDELLNDSLKLSYLEAFGLDNWEGYDLAMAQYYDENDIER